MSEQDFLQPMLTALAAVAAVFIVSVLGNLWKSDIGRRLAVWLAPATGYTAGVWSVRGLPGIPPGETAGWIFWAVVLLGLLGLVLPTRQPEARLWAWRLTMVALLLFLLSQPLLRGAWSGSPAGWILLPLTVIWMGGWGLAVLGSKTVPAWYSLSLSAISAIGLAALLMIGGVATYSHYALGLAGAIIAAGIAALPFVRRIMPDAVPAAGLICIPFWGLLVAGHFYADVPFLSVLFVFMAQLAFLLPVTPHFDRLKPLAMGALQFAWIVVGFTTAILWAYEQAPRFDF